MKIAFIGAGKMATAIARGLVENGVLGIDAICAVDVSAEARGAFSDATDIVCSRDAEEAVRGRDVVVLAVKPQVAEEAVRPLVGFCSGKLVVSIAAGLPLVRLCEWFESTRVVRVMPNTPLMVGKGASVYACGADVTDLDREFLQKLFGAAGIVFELDEVKLDAVTALSGSGPAYIFEMIQALVDGAVGEGLPAEVALQLTAQTVAGAAAMVQAELGTPDELRVAVTSPGGTTAAGLAVMRDAGFRTLMADVVRAATERSVELGRWK